MKIQSFLVSICACLLAACSDGVLLTPEGDNGGSLLPLTLEQHDSGFKATHFSGAGQCTTCHEGLQDDVGNDISIVSEWSGSMMANSARDPYWIAKVAAEIQRNPQLEQELNNGCSRCHAPMANEAARKADIDIQLLGDKGVLSGQHALFDHAMEGVSCTLCHQIEDDGLLGSVQGVSGNFSIGDYTQPSQRPAFGQYSDPSGIYMQVQTQFNARYGPHMSTSGLCAACHDLRTSGEGHSTASSDQTATLFPEQMVFSEWQNSAYSQENNSGKTCQNCHMPVVKGTTLLATEGGGIERAGFSRHSFLGANTVMQELLLLYREELGLTASASQLAESIVRNREFIKTAASLRITSAESDGQTLTATLNIDNQTGHKLPSGYPSRRVYIHFLVIDKDGAIVFESGKLNADGSVVGLDSDINTQHYERHYQLIDSENQVQVYESQMAKDGDTITHTLMDAMSYLKDNRLLPIGFDKASAASDIQVVGDAVQDENFDNGGDEIRYQLNTAGSGPYTIRAELIYQPLAYGHIQDLFASAAVEEVRGFKAMFEQSSLKAEIIDSQSVTLP